MLSLLSVGGDTALKEEKSVEKKRCKSLEHVCWNCDRWHKDWEVTSRQWHGKNGCIDVQQADYGVSEEIRLLDKASSHSPQTLNNSNWLFKKIRLGDQLGEFCLLYFLILKHTDFKPSNFRHNLQGQYKEHFKGQWWIFWPWNLQVIAFKFFSQSVF